MFCRCGDKHGAGVPTLGLAVALLLYRRNPRRFNFLQELCSLEMWGSGSHQKVSIRRIPVSIPVYLALLVYTVKK